ncbi:MAG: hypothetical protein JZU47_16785 [Prolixibacteraceae bacterium]|nr:hypothetical protein [Prolixibacteraceae bacterium]
MDNWTEIASFTYGYQAHMAKSKLESEEIEVWIKDELNALVCEAGPNAIGEIKLCVRKFDIIRAIHSLKEGGYIQESSETESEFTSKISKYTSKIPLIGKLAPELVLIIIFALVLILIYVPFAIMNL